MLRVWIGVHIHVLRNKFDSVIDSLISVEWLMTIEGVFRPVL